MSVYPILLHTGACLWYVFFWNNFLTNGSGQKESDWDPKYRDIHEMGTRYLTNWNLVIKFIVLIFVCYIFCITVNIFMIYIIIYYVGTIIRVI